MRPSALAVASRKGGRFQRLFFGGDGRGEFLRGISRVRKYKTRLPIDTFAPPQSNIRDWATTLSSAELAQLSPLTGDHLQFWDKGTGRSVGAAVMQSFKNKGELNSELTPSSSVLDRRASEAMRRETLLVLELTHRIAKDWTRAFVTVSEMARRSDSPTVKSTLSMLSSHLMRQAELMWALQIADNETLLDAGAYLGRVCLAVSRSRLEELNIHLVFAGEPIPMAADSCLRLGMIICELLSNSARHAFSDGKGGTIRVDLCRRGLIAECRVSDIGCARPNTDLGYGLAIARELLVGLGGSIKQDFGLSGSTSVLQLPL